jgi:hypothetical protein
MNEMRNQMEEGRIISDILIGMSDTRYYLNCMLPMLVVHAKRPPHYYYLLNIVNG